MKVISFSLWGDDPKYTIGAVRNAELAAKIYPDWKCRFYVHQDVPQQIIQQLRAFDNTELFLKKEDLGWQGMFWRFEPCFDPLISVSIFRDTDSRLNHREKFAVNEWLEGDKTFHIMRDHPYHAFPIHGGMWGYKNNQNYNMAHIFKEFKPSNKYGTDYDFFSSILYNIIGNDKQTHDEFFEKIPFPQKRNNYEFVGAVFDEKEEFNKDHAKILSDYLNALK